MANWSMWKYCPYCGGQWNNEAQAKMLKEAIVCGQCGCEWINWYKKFNETKVMCTCDAHCDSACPVHWRENRLEDRAIKAENKVLELKNERDAIERKLEESEKSRLGTMELCPGCCVIGEKHTFGITCSLRSTETSETA